MAKKYPEDIQKLLCEVVEHFDKEDRAVRDRQIRTWRRLKLIWEGFQRAWYSETAHDWRIWDIDMNLGEDTEQSYYDKPINVFRAYLESIIAALSVTVPPVKCYPDDADSPLDLSTAKAGDKIAQLVYRHNNVNLLWLHALFIYCTEGMVACYNYPKEDEAFGTYEKEHYEDKEYYNQTTNCPNCGMQMDQQTIDPEKNPEQVNPQLQQQQPPQQTQEDKEAQVDEITDPILNEFMPENVDVLNAALKMDDEQDICPNCMQVIVPYIQQQKFIVPKLVGVTQEPKTRMCLEAYGGLYVKIPNYAKNQEGCPYLIFNYETHYALAIERYVHLHSKLTADKVKASTGPKDPYEQWGRLNPQYQGEYPMNTVTIRNAWLRPACFNILPDKDNIERLKKYFPNGAKVVMVNDDYGEACPESLDDCWTIVNNPLSDYVHYDPLGLLLVSVQEITNDIISLTLQTIEHGIGQTFADPGVLDFNAYRQLEATPGGVYEATAKSGKSIGDGFYEMKTATLSPEVMPFATNIQNLAQLVSGALPSLFGGALEGSETASQYSMSRSQALQRLQNTWKMFCCWWKEIFGKTIPMFIKEIKDDERDVQRTKDGNFINVFIRKAEMEGRIGRVELEANENLPMTWSQIKDITMQLLGNQNPEVLAILGDPENLPVVREAIGLTDFYVPDEDQRELQYEEIKQLLNSTPQPNPQFMQMQQQAQLNPRVALDPQFQQQMQSVPQENPSVEIDPDYDNHQVHFRIVQKWATSEAGQQAKIDNPDGRRNVLLHGKLHLQQIQQQQMQQMQAQQQQQKPDKSRNVPPRKATEKERQPEAPITGEGNVQTIQ